MKYKNASKIGSVTLTPFYFYELDIPRTDWLNWKEISKFSAGVVFVSYHVLCLSESQTNGQT